MKSRMSLVIALFLVVAGAALAASPAPSPAADRSSPTLVAPPAESPLVADPYLQASKVTTTARQTCRLCVPPVVCKSHPNQTCPCQGSGRCVAVNGECSGVCGLCQGIYGCVSN